ncbi:MAG: type II toxin-antitoxin system Phd/YefM family antitoxin [Terriglobales bacterium]
MKTVNVAELKNRLSTYLQLVRDGEEVIVKDRNTPVARILPYGGSAMTEEEKELVASGAMKLPPRGGVNWKKFWQMPAPNLGAERALRAVLEEREEGR